MTNLRKVGTQYEECAARHLTDNGYQILTRNFRCPAGEIDLIARDGDYLVFIEVKARKGEGAGRSFSAVNHQKQRRICRAALHYLMRNNLPDDTPVRFDVVGFDAGEIAVVKNAFDFQR